MRITRAVVNPAGFPIMITPFICDRGHRWDQHDGQTTPTICPICGSALAPCCATVTQGVAVEGVPQATPSGTATLPMAGSAETQPVPLPELPGYEVQRLLGKGGMGIVILARQQQLGRLVAI